MPEPTRKSLSDRHGKKQSLVRDRLAAYRQRRSVRPRRQIPRAAVPSFFTLMNLFSGFLSIIQTFEGRFDYACWLIVLAAFFDVLDGMMARLTNTSSIFGIELDSLSDVVSFGVAPSVLVYVFGLREFGALGLISSSLPAICGAVRLARFNVGYEGEKLDYFVGLPIPGMAVIIVALILNFNNAEWFSRYSPSNLSVLVPIVILLSFLMISTIKFDAIPKPTTAYVKEHPRKFLAYGTGLLLVIFLQQIGLLVVLAIYVLFNIGRAGRTLVNAITAEGETVEESSDEDAA
jgi:CDP-diacylglycerol--serine O-phosphatidyltransferase